MPQLDPSPWFFILFTSWTIFLLFAPLKVSKFFFLSDPDKKASQNLNKSWLWPWS
uniref:ATP synthase complex subunit 8 n=1 Tax=Ameerega hahneli TaxID=161872 RepID=A0A7M3USN9_9NEOB|nr:ATP synthase F0 subunit 8 [Ameerega hahneli]